MATRGPDSPRIHLRQSESSSNDSSDSEPISSQRTASFGSSTVSETSSRSSFPEAAPPEEQEHAKQTSKRLVDRAAAFVASRSRLVSIASSSSDESHSSTPATQSRKKRIASISKLRSNNREKFSEWTNLDDPKSLGSTVFKNITGTTTQFLSDVERKYLQETMLEHIEPLIGRGEPETEASKLIERVIVEESLATQLLPNLNGLIKSQSSSSTPCPIVLTKLTYPQGANSDGDIQAKAIQAQAKAILEKLRIIFPEVMSTLRTQYFEALHSGSPTEQSAAYDRLQVNLLTAKGKILRCNQLIVLDENSSEFTKLLKKDLDLIVKKLNQELELLNTLQAQDYRVEDNYIHGAKSVLDPAWALIQSERFPTKPKKDVKAFKTFVKTKREELSKLDRDKIRPSIIRDLRLLQEECYELAKNIKMKPVEKPAAQASKEEKELEGESNKLRTILKADVQAWRSEHGWQPTSFLVPVRQGLKTALYTIDVRTVESMFGRQGGVPSTAQHVTDKPCNALVHTVRSTVTNTPVDNCIRSAVLTPYMEDNEDKRTKGTTERARQEIVAGLLNQFDGDAEALEKFCGTEAHAANIEVLLNSYLTTDKARSYLHIHDNELKMHVTTCEALQALTSNGGHPTQITFEDKHGNMRTIYVRPKLAVTCCGSNGIALKWGELTRPWHVADIYNRDAVLEMTGSEFPDDDIEGWVGERLNQFESTYRCEHPNRERIIRAVNEWRTIILLDEHHEAKNDTFKGTNPPDEILNLLRTDNAAVAACMREHPPTEDDAARAPRVLNPIVIRFCKSGKDRTGAGVASISRRMAEADMTGRNTISEPSFTEDRQFNAQAFAMSMQMLIQLWNGAMGYKTDGEKNLIGPTLHAARKHSQ
ncbi:inositol phosphate phosphatase SopB [Parendozoicomonas sp. Alg238-R29]|uniref:inositol phosphate phosphatase SopB n=1 Tax=Parendozoicomonas sp. Alg238-R29 TaxID=2993446 RepID=UPI00248EE5B7|nr:inositol phosphate phosphatase SopB [Parendozoicomonas sp. Alg238-R29]